MTNAIHHPPHRLLAAMLFLLAMLLHSCGHGSSDSSSTHDLRALDDSVSALAPSALDSIRAHTARATDSIAYNECLLRLARYYQLSEHPERADTVVEQIVAFARRQDNNYYGTHHTCRTPRLNAIMAGALACKATRNHNFHRDPKETVRLYSEALRLFAASTAEHEMPKACANLADAYIQTNDLPQAARCYRRALFLADSLKLPQKENVTLYMGLAQIYLSLHDFDTALKYYNATERRFSLMSPGMQAYYVNNLGNFYYYTKDYPKALATFLRMKRMLTARGMQNKFDMYLCKINLADVYLNLGQLDKARLYLGEVEPFFRKTGDPTAIYYCNTIHIGIATRAKNTAEVERVLREEKPDSSIMYNMVNIRNEYMQRYYELTGDYRKAYSTLQENICYTDSLEHNRSNMRSAEIMARFTADTLQLHHDLALEHKNADIQRANVKATAAVATATVLALLLAVWFMHTRKKQLQSQIDIMNLKLNNARNRISPHFMFNVLNNKIVSSDKKEASELTELARLIRTNLDMSSQPYMMLDKELEFVNQYIRVERYLLGDDFAFTVDITDDVDTTSVKIPAMFLQILTENAIVHGLKGIEGHKALNINISRNGCTTVISVSDNGPGFNAHRTLKKGTGLGIITQTIAVTNEHNKQKMRFGIHNREDAEGRIIGCEATLTVPDNIIF